MTQDLEHSEKLFRLLAEAMPQIVWITRADGWNIYFNQQWMDYTGLSLEESYGHGWNKPFHPDDQRRAWDAWQNAVTNNGSYSLECRLRRRDGAYRWWLIRGVPLLDEHGTILKWFGTCTDIEDLKRTEEALRESEAKYHSVVSALAEGIVLQDATGEIRASNASAERILGLSVEQMTGRTSVDPRWRAVHEDGTPFPGEQHPAMVTLRTGLPCSNVVMGVHKPDGELTWISINSIPLFRPGGSGVLDGVVASFFDITERKRAEEALRESEERYRLLFDDNPQPMWVCDAVTGGFLEVNAAAVRRYGYSRSELLGMELRHIQIGGGNGLPAPNETAPQQHCTKDGRWLTVEVTSGLVSHRGRKAVLMLLNDVTQSLKLEAELRQAQKMDAIGRLAGGIAHDFNNILMAIGGYATMAARSAASAGIGQRELDQILASVDRAAALVQQLLAFGRRQVLKPAVLDLNAIVLGLQPMLRRLIPENIHLMVTSEPGPVRVKADQAQLDQVVLNLVVNARDAMPEGGTLTIETRRPTAEERSSLAGGEYVVLSVRDTGAGIPAEDQAHVFEPFFTTKPLGQGTGLGLPTVFGIVKQSGGEISFETEVGRGTSFHIFLPETVLPVKAPAERVAPPVALSAPAGTVLLVEDDPMVREIVLYALESDGYTVLVAADGEEALRRFERSPIDVLVTDLMMPKMGGQELARRLRERTPNLGVLFISGYSGDGFAESGGVVDARSAFLEKPVRVSYLLETVQRLVRTP